jgi:glutamine synthetase
VDEYQDFLRCTVASAGNDHRLGGGEAPPAIISVFLGAELNAIIQSIIDGTNYKEQKKTMLRIGVDVLPAIPKDTTDRNRTSPLAFTGNKFEFRMVGSSQSISEANIALNTIMAEQLSRFADILETAEDFDKTLHDLVCDIFTRHQRILFDGNGYSLEWKEEAARRGLSNYPSTAECLPSLIQQKNIDLVVRHGIYTETEFRARYAIHLEAYNKRVAIEARTMIDMAMHQILPAALHYTKHLCDALAVKQNLGVSCHAESVLVHQLSGHTDSLYDVLDTLQHIMDNVPGDLEAATMYYHDSVIPGMNALRREADALEALTEKSCWPYPTYSDLLFY